MRKLTTWLKSNFHWLWRLVLILLCGLLVLAMVSLPIRRESNDFRIIAVGKAPAASIAFWASVAEGMQAAAREYKVTVDYRSPGSESEVDTQIAMLRQAIAEKPDAIILAALDETRLIEPAREAKIAGIPLVIVDSGLSSGESLIHDCFVATDNVIAGRQLGEAFLDLLPPGETIVLVSPSTKGDSLIKREIGVREAVGDRYDILPTLDVRGGSSEAVYELVSLALAENPSIAGIIALNEYTSAGAARAIRGASLTGQVWLVGFDGSEELINYLEEGLLSAVVIQRPFNMGYLAVVRTLDVLNRRPVDLFYDTGSILVTKDTIYLEENEKLLFPFT